MDKAEFLAALNTVEQDHELVLQRVQSLKETVELLLNPREMDAHQVLNRLQEVHNFFTKQFTAHMNEEETDLFPFLQEYSPVGEQLVAQLKSEHEDLTRKLEEFGNCLDVSLQLEDHLPKTVQMDLLVYGLDLWESLDKHAHVETQAVHQCIAESVKKEE